MSTLEQRQRLKAYYALSHQLFDEWAKRGYQYPPPPSLPFPEDLRGLACGAKTRAGTPSKLMSTYDNGRCKFHGGVNTGPKTAAGKAKVALNGLKPKRKKQSS